MRARRVRRNNPVTLQNTGHVDHFKRAGVKRGQCRGNIAGARALDFMVVLFRGYASVVFRHPTKTRTRGRVCFATVKRAAA